MSRSAPKQSRRMCVHTCISVSCRPDIPSKNKWCHESTQDSHNKNIQIVDFIISLLSFWLFAFWVSPLIIDVLLVTTHGCSNQWLLVSILLSLTSIQLYLNYWYHEVNCYEFQHYIFPPTFVSRFTLVVAIWKFRSSVFFGRKPCPGSHQSILWDLVSHSTFASRTGPPSLFNIAFSDYWSVYYKVLYEANRNLSGLKIPVEIITPFPIKPWCTRQTLYMNNRQFSSFPLCG